MSWQQNEQLALDRIDALEKKLDGLHEALRGAEKDGAAIERAACAELVRGAGCLCFPLDRAGVFDGGFAGSKIRAQPGGAIEDLRFVDVHDERCPIALAAAIEARKN